MLKRLTNCQPVNLSTCQPKSIWLTVRLSVNPHSFGLTVDTSGVFDRFDAYLCGKKVSTRAVDTWLTVDTFPVEGWQ